MEIKIIHKKDTMYINQISGYGSIVDINEFEMNTNKVEKQTEKYLEINLNQDIHMV